MATWTSKISKSNENCYTDNGEDFCDDNSNNVNHDFMEIILTGIK